MSFEILFPQVVPPFMYTTISLPAVHLPTNGTKISKRITAVYKYKANRQDKTATHNRGTWGKPGFGGDPAFRDLPGFRHEPGFLGFG